VTGTFPRASGPLGIIDGPVSAAVSEDHSVAVVWNTQDLGDAVIVDLATREVVPLSPPARDAHAVDHKPLSSGDAVLWDDGAVTLIDRTGAVVQELPVPGSAVADVALAPDGTWAVTVGQGGVVLWDVDPGTGRWSQGESLPGHTGDVLAADIDPSGERMVTTSADNTVIAWDVSPDGGFGTAQPGIRGRWPAGTPVMVRPGRLVVVPTRGLPRVRDVPYHGEETLDVAATFLDPTTGAVVAQVPVGNTVPDAYFGTSGAVSPDGKFVAVTSGLATTVLDTRTRQVVKRITLPPDGAKGLDGRPYPTAAVCCAVWTPDGSRLLLGSGGHLPGQLIANDPDQPPGEIAVVDTTTWKPVDRIPLDLAPSVMQLDDDRRRLAVGSSNSSEIVVLDAATLAVIQRVRLRVDDSMWALAFSPDGRFLAGGGESGKVHVVDTATWQAREAVAVRASDPLIHLGWLDDNRTVVSAGPDGTVVLFDVERALVRVAPLPASTDGGQGYTVVLPGTGKELSVLADDRPGLRYPMDPSVWVREACDVAGRDLTRAEWNRYLPNRPWAPTCSDLG
jgi:WD40 repeat protein